MNQLDASASPMFDCFTDPPNFTPFTSVPNRFPLDKITPDPKKIADRRLRQRAIKGADAPYPEWAVKPVEDPD